MKMHKSEMTSCRYTSSSVGMEQSQFLNHFCSKDQVGPNYLAAAIQVEQKLLALLRSRWVWSRRIILPRCALSVRAAVHCSARHTATRLVGAEVSWHLDFDLLFLIQVYFQTKKNMHTRHDDIVLQILTAGQIYRAATGAWIGPWCSCPGVVIQGRIEPQTLKMCRGVWNKRSQWGFYMYMYTHEG